uniref:Fucosyltransferase n=1 Tax=Meleagris gallopavo TaxID=9103 RepID=G3UUK2_MELGA
MSFQHVGLFVQSLCITVSNVLASFFDRFPFILDRSNTARLNTICFCLGTDLSIDSLPLPRKDHHDWAIFHEESPKNNYKLFHEPAITLFNHTATFSRHSHLPLTTQYLENVEVLRSLRHMIPVQVKNSLRKRLAPLVYVQSDCNAPSDRDSYVRELMCHIEVDSYGECLHNRDLPQYLRNPSAMNDGNFYKILAQYKFILAFENAICEDYITEKLWRPLMLGVVPVYFGSPSIIDWLPSNKSAILVSSFSHPRELAHYIKTLDQNDREYEAYLEWKLKGDISNPRLLTAMKELVYPYVKKCWQKLLMSTVIRIDEKNFLWPVMQLVNICSTLQLSYTH